MTETIHEGPGKAYVQRRVAEGDSRQREVRSLKRRRVQPLGNYRGNERTESKYVAL